MYHILVIGFALNVLFLGLRYLVEGSLGSTWLAWEAVWLPIVLMILPLSWRRWSIAFIAAALTLVLLLAGIDRLTQLAFGRLFNPLLDLGLVDSAFNQLTENVGVTLTLAILASVLTIFALSTWFIARSLGALHWPALTMRRRLVLGLALIVSLTFDLARPGGLTPHSATPALDLVATHWQQLQNTRRAYADFKQHVADKGSLAPGRFPTLSDRDVILGFIESYGVTALYDPRYAKRITPRLADIEQRLKEAGIHLASAKLTSPVQGGQSWLAHATLLSGLWVSTQRHYELLLGQRQSTLIDDFRKTGHRNIAIMPALTQAWPQGKQLGYDHIFTAHNIPYQGPALNWVTMPDQFTWRFLETRRQAHHGALFAELALISSHAPWTPILPLLEDWEGLDDGRVFERWANSGETPETLWRDTEKVREHYAKAVEYALTAAFGYAERYLRDDALLILVGDHQPAPLITGDDASREVPIHILSRDKALITPFMEAGFDPGMMPNRQSSARAMSDFRPLMHTLFAE
ncbi:alkaline phosphatase [Halomonas sp. GXIMD04776]|uniref:alkaline phosphatase n=1 Tax=Halomonas sp. GXIMD04776 TaxID=3415605 RepID=UPI003CBA0A73